MKKIFASLLVMGLTTSFVFGQAAIVNSSPIQEKTTFVPSKNEFSLTFGTFNMKDESKYVDQQGNYSFSFGFKHHFSNRFSMSLNNEYGFFDYDMMNDIASADVSMSSIKLLSHFKVFSVDDISVEVGGGLAYTRLTDNYFKIYFKEGFNPNTQLKEYQSYATQIHAIDEDIALPVQIQVSKSFEKCKVSLGYEGNLMPENTLDDNRGTRFYVGLSIPL